MSDGERRLAAIMLTDIVGFTAMGQTNEALMLERLERHRELMRAIFPKHNGREVKTIGDAFLVVFPSALEAVRCSIAIQEQIHEMNLALPEAERLQIRVGVHLGDVVQSDGDILGDAVNVSSRIEPLATPGGICISQQVYDHVRNKIDLPLEKLEERALKNVSLPVDVYRVVMPWEARGEYDAELDPLRIAVLPLLNISQDKRDEYFADGLTEELISTVSNLSELSVISQTSVMGYKGATKKVREIGKELEVGSILEGSVRMAGTRLRVTVQLIDVKSDRHLWAQSYDRELDDVFAIQSDIAQRIAETLKVKLLEGEKVKLERAPTRNMAAYESYLRGIYLMDVDWSSAEEALHQLEEAIRLDPEFSLAYSALGNLYVALSGETMPLREAFEKAEPLIAKALDLDDGSSGAHVARGNLSFQYYMDWGTAEAEFKRAIELNPNCSDAYIWWAMLRLVTGDVDGALELSTRARELDPLSFLAHRQTAYCLLIKRRPAEAVAICERLVRLQPETAENRVMMAYVCCEAGKLEEANKEADVARGLKILPHVMALLAAVYALLGRREEARELIREIEAGSPQQYCSPTHLATAYAALGERDTALRMLEEEFEEDPTSFLFNFQLSPFYSLRDDPRFVSLKERLKLPKRRDD